MRTSVGEKGLGALRYRDDRDRAYPITEFYSVSQAETRGWRYWWDQGWFGDQGTTPQCVAYSHWHAFIDGPQTAGLTEYDENMPYKPPQGTEWLYCEAQKRDPWEGDCESSTRDYDGTSVRAGAKTLQKHGYLKEYRWCETLDEVARAILKVGPVVAGTVWFNSMSFPDKDGYISIPSDENSPVGGHAYVLNGVNVEREVLRIKNSWSDSWGDKGRAWLPFEEFEKLLKYHAELCVPIPASME